MNKVIYILVLAIFFLLIKKFTVKKVKVKSNMIPTGKKQYIEFMTPYAKTIEAKTGIPYKFLLAQTGLETAWGKSSLLQKYYNFGGIKAKANEKSVTLMTKEFVDGKMIDVPQKFYVAPDIITGLTHYAKILLLPRYKKAFQYKDPILFANEIKKGGYATDPNYVTKLTTIINTI